MPGRVPPYLVPFYAEPAEVVHCYAFNPMPVSVKINKWLCPEWVDEELFSLGERGLDEEGLLEAGCVPGEGYSFGSYEYEDYPILQGD